MNSSKTIKRKEETFREREKSNTNTEEEDINKEGDIFGARETKKVCRTPLYTRKTLSFLEKIMSRDPVTKVRQ